MKLQALEDCDEIMTSYTYTDTEYSDSDIRIRVNAVADAPRGQLVRCNLLYAIKTLAIAQLTRQYLFGAMFTESYHTQLLYEGTFDNKSDFPSLQQPSNLLTDASETVAQNKRALRTHLLDPKNSSTTLLTIPGSNDVHYQVDFSFRGKPVARLGLFTAILDFMMTLAQRKSDDSLENISHKTTAHSLWIFVLHDPGTSFPLQVFQLLAILEGMARWIALRRHYREMTFSFLINGEEVARGCITAPMRSREWCREYAEADQEPLVVSTSSS